MPRRVGLILAAALVAGGLAAYLAYSVLQAPVEAVEARAANIEVVDVAVAARDMRAGTLIGPDDVRLVEWPARSVPSGFSRSPSEVVGRGLLTDVKANEPFLASRVASKEAGGGLPVIIPPGKRAMSVRVDDVVGVAGFVLPGTRVDVLVTLDQGAGEQIPRTRVVLQNIGVASAGQTIERDEEGEPQSVPVVTLLVDPEEAEKLALASSKGNIRLALRNSLDFEAVATPGISASRLIADEPSPSPPRRPRPTPQPRPQAAPGPETPARYNVEVFRGPERSTSTVESREGENAEEQEEEERS